MVAALDVALEHVVHVPIDLGVRKVPFLDELLQGISLSVLGEERAEMTNEGLFKIRASGRRR